MKVRIGQKINSFTVETINGEQQMVPDPSRKFTHLQFRRFAGCPICNYHLHTFTKSAEQLKAADIQEIILFHSSATEMRKFQHDIPFATVADPEKTLYKKFGVDKSLFATMHPKPLWAGIRGMVLGKVGLKVENGPLGLPADILINQEGIVVAFKYGTHAYDQWEVNELLKIA
ncbi:peroxiredoxin-like family protein [Solimicrobium silvestre]|uniref:AhpC/TSA family n=1 Tax=Solimicrobium silvestre TaxID=2099400 RepID=A0A2S9GSP7_9BURK|nr:peroxiredoxin-like family protein [Solimicrobium silvestre]PRC90733.1 AhpC/TSA family [Solimicrobium silvestre]